MASLSHLALSLSFARWWRDQSLVVMEAGIQQLIIGLGAIQILPLYSERQGENQKTESADNLRECDSDQRVKKNFWNFSGRHIYMYRRPLKPFWHERREARFTDLKTFVCVCSSHLKATRLWRAACPFQWTLKSVLGAKVPLKELSDRNWPRGREWHTLPPSLGNIVEILCRPYKHRTKVKWLCGQVKKELQGMIKEEEK